MQGFPTNLDFLAEMESSISPSRRRCRDDKLLFESRSPKAQGELEALSSPSRRKHCGDQLHMDVFRAFAFGRQQMFPKDFERLCFSCALFDGKFMKCDARRIFDGQLKKGQRSIGLQQFEKLLHDIAFERDCHVATVHDMLTTSVKSSGRQRHPLGCASSALELHHGENIDR